MFRLYGLFGLVYFAVYVYTVLDVILAESTLIRNLPKITWVFLVIFLGPVGVIAWFVAGRPEGASLSVGGSRSRGGQAGRNASTRGNPGRSRPSVAPKGPDDDPDFMRRLDEKLRRDQAPDEAAGDDGAPNGD